MKQLVLLLMYIIGLIAKKVTCDPKFNELEDIEDIEEVTEGVSMKLADGLEVTVNKKAKKCVRRATAGDNLTVHYVGRLHTKKGEIFDETKSKLFPFKFQLGGGRIIEGLERGVRGMCRGEVRSFLV